MVAESELEGLDPFDLWDREAERLDAYVSSLPDDRWRRPSRCAGWTVRDVVAHLLTAEDYHRACLDGTVAELLASLAERGGTDLDSANQVALDALQGVGPAELVPALRTASASSRAGFRARGDGTVDTSIGAYPCRWQAFHVASEFATHADDIYVPEDDRERPSRTAWRARFSRFALSEAKPDLDVVVEGDRTRVRGRGIDVELWDPELVEAVMARLDERSRLSPDERGVLSVNG